MAEVKELDRPAGAPHNAKLTPKLCPACGYKFWARMKNAKYCSHLCRTHAWQKRVEKWKHIETWSANEGDKCVNEIFISKFWNKNTKNWHKEGIEFRQVATYRGKEYLCWFIPKGKQRSFRLYVNKAHI